ncbi:MAG TPA: zinc ribbon domain-containing protein [Mycobacteriales bacterium]
MPAAARWPGPAPPPTPPTRTTEPDPRADPHRWAPARPSSTRTAYPGGVPRYEYRCRTCQTTFELSRPMADSSAPADCPHGHAETVKLPSSVAVAGAASAGGGGGCCGGSCGCGCG